MFCKNCGNSIDPGAEICVQCGFKNGNGNKYCANCGQPVAEGAAVCTNCGVATAPPAPAYKPEEQKSKLVAGLLGILLGYFGVHNFYLGYTGKAVAQLLITLLTCGMGATVTAIWGLIEGVMILCGSINKDAKGVPLKD